MKGTNVIFVAKHITFLSLGKKRRLPRLEATMPHPQQLKKKRKKGNTKVERRSRELHPDFFFCFDFSGKQSFFFSDVADFSVFSFHFCTAFPIYLGLIYGKNREKFFSDKMTKKVTREVLLSTCCDFRF